MPSAGKISEQEKEEILQIAAKAKAENPKIKQTEIGEVVGRSKAAVSKLVKLDKFEEYRSVWKKKIDKRRLRTISQADDQIEQHVRSGKMKPYQLIGLSKTFYEQSFPEVVQGNGTNTVNVGVRIVREVPQDATYSDGEVVSEPE